MEENAVDHKQLIVLYASVFVSLVGFGIMIPLLPYLAISMGADELSLGAMTTAYSLMQMLGNLVWGGAADKIGEKNVLCMCLLGSGLSYVALGLADSVTLLIVLRGVSGFCSGTIGVTQAFVTRIVPQREAGIYLGYVGACLGAGFAFGPGLGSMCLVLMGFQGPCFFAGALCVVSFVGGLVLLKDPSVKVECLLQAEDSEPTASPPKKSMLSLVREQPRSLCLFVSTACYYTAFAAFEGMGALYFKNVFSLSAEKFGGICTLSGLGAMFLQMFAMKKIISCLGIRCSGIVAHLIRSIAYLLVVLSHAAWSPYVMGVLIAGGSFLSPATATMLAALTPADQRGAVLGMNQTFAALGRVLGPMGSAALYATMPSGMWYAAALVSFAGALLFSAVELPAEEEAERSLTALVSATTNRVLTRAMSSMCTDERECPAFFNFPELVFEQERNIRMGEQGSLFEAMYGHKAYVGGLRGHTHRSLERHNTF
eukprot:TRINITY_DN105575_c0_g1_i1.p1 TRINITY_DN105575_c0_g1~~TRINITY_DN105575_c0_g1_i1.p1  ORF type:complete len:498 (+),score=65.13 TRINITY_DN105575_c0_g1_i1:43-1494(+)